MKNLKQTSNVKLLFEEGVKKLKKLSQWAKINPKLARIIIAISHVLVYVNSIFLGILLFLFDWGASKWLLVIVANLFFISYIFYPKKSKKKNKRNCSYLQYNRHYIRQKAHDFSLVISYSIVIALGVNNFLMQPIHGNNKVQQPIAKFIVYKPKVENHTTNRKQLKSEFKQKFKKVRKQIKQELRNLKKELKKKKDKKGSRLVKLLLFLLTVAAAVVLGFLILALSCNLSCSGKEGLAWVVLFLGWTGIIWLGIIVLKKIFRMGT